MLNYFPQSMTQTHLIWQSKLYIIIFIYQSRQTKDMNIYLDSVWKKSKISKLQTCSHPSSCHHQQNFLATCSTWKHTTLLWSNIAQYIYIYVTKPPIKKRKKTATKKRLTTMTTKKKKRTEKRCPCREAKLRGYITFIFLESKLTVCVCVYI